MRRSSGSKGTVLTISFALEGQYGLCWQVVPARLTDLLKTPKAMQAMMQMKKLDIAALERAAQS